MTATQYTIALTVEDIHTLNVAFGDCIRFRSEHAKTCRELEAERDEDDPYPWIEAAERSEAVVRSVRELMKLFPCP